MTNTDSIYEEMKIFYFMKRLTVILAFTLIWSLSNATLKAQNSSNFNTQKNAWLSIYTGTIFSTHAHFAGYGAMLSYSNNQYVISTRYLSFRQLHFYEPASAKDINFLNSPRKLENFDDVSILAGYIFNKRYMKFITHAGLGYSKWVENEHFKNHKLDGVSVPIDVNLLITPLPLFGIGFHSYCILNTQRSISGILLSMQFGKLW